MWTSMGVADPGHLILTTGHQAQEDLLLPWSSKAACPWFPAITPEPDDRFRPAAAATAVQE